MTNTNRPSPPLPPGVSGKHVAVAIFLVLSGIALFTYYAVPQFVIPYFRAKPALAEAAFDNLEDALRRYAADHGGALPPEELLINHRRHNKNVHRARALGIMTLRVSALTTPTAYLQEREWGDPYALPEQFVPPAYQAYDFPDAPDERWVVLASPGPNLRHDVRTPALRSIASLEELHAYLEANSWREDAGNAGDLVRLVRIPLSGASPGEQ